MKLLSPILTKQFGYLALRLYWGLYKGEKVKVHFTKSGYPFRFRPSVWFLFSS